MFPASAAMVSWVNMQSGILESVAWKHSGAAIFDAIEVDSEQGLPKVALEKKMPIAIASVQTDPRSTNPEFLRRHALSSYLGMPLVMNGKALGVLSLYTQAQREFADDEMEFLKALVSQATMAIYNSRLYENTRLQAVELERSNRIKDDFLGVISHELRTPLNVIMNYAELLGGGIFGNLSAEQLKGANKISGQSQHLLALINEILEITKIESRTTVLQNAALDLRDFMKDLESNYTSQLEIAVDLEWLYAQTLPITMIDSVKLKQIAINLIDNAIKFTEQGRIEVSMQYEADRGRICFAVADTGPGIPPELVPCIFEKFRQVDGSRTRHHAGLGLGLFIVKSFVDLMGGEIQVQTELGKGSRFEVTLPLVMPGRIGREDNLAVAL